MILSLALCAVVAGARSFTAIAEWAADADEQTLHMLGTGSRVPSESTFRRVIAVDGKTLRGSASGGEAGDHLLAALDHAHGAVLGQVEIDAKTNEIPGFSVLLEGIDITGAVITADAMYAQRGHATYLAGRGARYLLTVKRNREHYVRDVTFREDAQKARTGSQLSAYAAIRNLVIGATRHAGFANVVHARRHYARDDQRILVLYGYA